MKGLAIIPTKLLKGLSPWLVVALWTVINTFTSALLFWGGRACKWEWLEKKMKVDFEKLKQYQEKVERYGLVSALFTWIPGGNLICVALGLMKMPVGLTLALIGLGKLCRNAFVIFALGWSLT